MNLDTMRRGAETPVLAGPADADAVAADLADAFSDDVMFDWFLRDDPRRAAARLAFFRLLVGRMAMGVARIERPPGGGAAAVWMPLEAVGPTPFMTLVRALPTLLGATGVSRLAASWRLWRIWTGITPWSGPTPISGSSA